MFIPLAEPLPSVLAAAAVWGLSACGDPGVAGREKTRGQVQKGVEGSQGSQPSGVQRRLELVTTSPPAPPSSAPRLPPPTIGCWFSGALNVF